MTFEEAIWWYKERVKVSEPLDKDKQNEAFYALIKAANRIDILESKIDRVKDYCEETSGEYWAVNILEMLED